MIVNSFDDKSPSKINPRPKENRLKCDACIVTFSNVILDYVLKNYDVEQCSTFKMVTGTFPIYKINYNGKVFAFYQTFLGAPASVGILEDVTEVIDTDKFVVFGGSGCLDKNIAHGKIMIPTEVIEMKVQAIIIKKRQIILQIQTQIKLLNLWKAKNYHMF